MFAMSRVEQGDLRGMKNSGEHGGLVSRVDWILLVVAESNSTAANQTLWSLSSMSRRNAMNGSTELFMAQGDHRIDAHGAASGDVTSSHCNAEQNDAHGAKGQGIRRRNSIEKASHQVCERKRGRGAGA